MAALGLRLRGPRWALGGLGLSGVPSGVPGVPVGVPGVPLGVPSGVPARAMAGHNRWSKVRNVKGPRDAERSRRFERLARLLRAAAREGGADPALNPALAAVVQQCRAHNMPRATIEAALRPEKEAAGGSSLLLLGARGPGGSELLLEVLSPGDSRGQLGDIRGQLGDILAQHGGSLAEGVRQSFEPLGVLRVSGRTLPLEAALELALAAGARDVLTPEEEEEEEELKFLCDPSSLRNVRQHLEAAGLRPLSAAVEFRPLAPLELPPEPRAEAERLLRALAERPDVVRLFHNIRRERPGKAEGHSPPAAGQ